MIHWRGANEKLLSSWQSAKALLEVEALQLDVNSKD